MSVSAESPVNHDDKQKSRIEYVIFDMDGLLIDSERIYTEVTNRILEPYGVQMTWDIKAGCMGKPEVQAAEHLLSAFPNISLKLEDYLAQRNNLQDALWPTVQLLPGAARLVKHLHKHHIPIALASGTRRANFDMKTSHLQTVFGCFVSPEGKELVICGDDARLGKGRGKPFPDMFLLAARELLGVPVGTADPPATPSVALGEEVKVARAKGLVFEDAIPGVHAAKRAGMHVVWVPDPNLVQVAGGYKEDGAEGGKEEEGLDADQTLSSLKDFVPEQWGLPPYVDDDDF